MRSDLSKPYLILMCGRTALAVLVVIGMASSTFGQEPATFFGIPLNDGQSPAVVPDKAEMAEVRKEQDSDLLAGMPESVVLLKAQYSEAIQVVNAPLKALRKSYLGRLGELKETAQANGNLESLTKLTEEIEVLQSETPWRFGVDDLQAELVTLRRTFLNAALAREAIRCQITSKVNAVYREELAKLVSKVTREGDLEGAQATQKLRERVPETGVVNLNLLLAERFPHRVEAEWGETVGGKWSYSERASALGRASYLHPGRSISVRSGGGRALKITYSAANRCVGEFSVNGSVAEEVIFSSTGSWDNFRELEVATAIPDGALLNLLVKSGKMTIDVFEVEAPFAQRSSQIGPFVTSFSDLIAAYPELKWKGHSPFAMDNPLQVSFSSGTFHWRAGNSWSGEFREEQGENGSPNIFITGEGKGRYKLQFSSDFRICHLQRLQGPYSAADGILQLDQESLAAAEQ